MRKFATQFFLLVLAVMPLVAFTQESSKPTKAQKAAEKKKEQQIKKQRKAELKGKARHYKLQDKKTRKRMKKHRRQVDKKFSSDSSDFFKRLFRKKHYCIYNPAPAKENYYWEQA